MGSPVEPIASVDSRTIDMVRQLLEDIRLRDQSGEVGLTAKVLVDPEATIFRQLSLEPSIRYRDPRTRSSQKLGLRKSILRMFQAPADLKLGNVPTGVIEDAVVGAVYSGEEIGLLSNQTLFVELITFGSKVGAGWNEQRVDYYVPLTAIEGYTSYAVLAPQGE